MKPILCFLCLFPLLFDCTRHSVAGTETDTGSIAGYVVDAEKNGIENAVVIVRDPAVIEKYTIGSTVTGAVSKKAAVSKSSRDTVTTASSGYFSFNSLPYGHYYLEVIADDSFGLVVEVTLTAEIPAIVDDTVSVRRCGTVEGSLCETLVHQDSTLLYIVELDRTVPVDSAGEFLIRNVPPWEYSIKLIENGTIISSMLDTITIRVEEHDTTKVYNLGTTPGSITIEGIIHE